MTAALEELLADQQTCIAGMIEISANNLPVSFALVELTLMTLVDLHSSDDPDVFIIFEHSKCFDLMQKCVLGFRKLKKVSQVLV